MTSLLGSYRQEKSREKKSQVTGSGEYDVYKSKWFAFTWFKFLSERGIPNDTVDTIYNNVVQCASEETRQELINEEPITEEHTPTSSHQDDSSAQTTMSTVTSVSQSKKKKCRNNVPNDKAQNEMLLEAYSISKETSETPSDHYETFGNHVASELRKFDTQTLHLKKAILDVLFRPDIGEFTPTYYVHDNRGGYYSTFSTSSHHSHPPTLTSPPPTSSYMVLADTSNPSLHEKTSLTI